MSKTHRRQDILFDLITKDSTHRNNLLLEFYQIDDNAASASRYTISLIKSIVDHLRLEDQDIDGVVTAFNHVADLIESLPEIDYE